MPFLLETSLYILAATLGVAGIFYAASLWFFPVKSSEREDDEPYGEANTYRRER